MLYGKEIRLESQGNNWAICLHNLLIRLAVPSLSPPEFPYKICTTKERSIKNMILIFLRPKLDYVHKWDAWAGPLYSLLFLFKCAKCYCQACYLGRARRLSKLNCLFLLIWYHCFTASDTLHIMLLSLYIVTAYLEVLFLPLYDGVTALYSFVVCLWIKNNRINSFWLQIQVKRRSIWLLDLAAFDWFHAWHSKAPTQVKCKYNLI